MVIIPESFGIVLPPSTMTLGRSFAPNPGMEVGMPGMGSGITAMVVTVGKVGGSLGLKLFMIPLEVSLSE